MKSCIQLLRIISLALLIVFVPSCNHLDRAGFEILSAESSIKALSDSVFLSGNNPCLATVGNSIFVSDFIQGMFESDKEGRLIRSFARPGNGPGEVLACSHFSVAEDGIVCVFDAGHHAIQFYLNGIFLKRMDLPSELRITPGSRFFVINDSLYCTSVGKEHLVYVVKDGAIVDIMCPLSQYDDPKMPIHSARHVVKADSSFFLIARGLPVVEEYSYSGELLSSFDLSIIPERAEVFRREQSIVPNTYFAATEDAVFVKGRLYILSASSVGGYHCDNIIVIENKDGELKYTGTYKLSKGEVYTSIAVSDEGGLFALNYSDTSIDIFKLPEE